MTSHSDGSSKRLAPSGGPGYLWEDITTRRTTSGLGSKSGGSTDAKSGSSTSAATGYSVSSEMDRIIARLAGKVEAVGLYPFASELLAELYDKSVLHLSDLGMKLGPEKSLALSALAAADLCEVDPTSVRITQWGQAFVEYLTTKID